MNKPFRPSTPGLAVQYAGLIDGLIKERLNGTL